MGPEILNPFNPENCLAGGLNVSFFPDPPQCGGSDKADLFRTTMSFAAMENR